MSATKSNNTCFVICPIGEANSETRKRSDQLLRHVILPAAIKTGYPKDCVLRADQLPDPGIITDQVIQHLLTDSMVIADLTGHNPNVFYELAIRHAVRKPIVQLIQVGQTLPFDIAPMRTVKFNLSDPDELDESVERLAAQIFAAQKNPLDADNPISASIDAQFLKTSNDPSARVNAKILEAIQALSTQVSELKAIPPSFEHIYPKTLLFEGATLHAPSLTGNVNAFVAATGPRGHRSADLSIPNFPTGEGEDT